MKANEREQALNALIGVFKQHTPLSHFIPHLTPFGKELCFGVCRHAARLESLAHALVQKKPKEIEIWLVLLLGLYQLHYLELPDYAVVTESVNLLKNNKNRWAKGLINAVLRNYCRRAPALKEQLANDLHAELGQPSWLLDLLKKAWPKDWQTIATANDTHAPMSLRVNTHFTDRDSYLNALLKIGINATKHVHAHSGLTVTTPLDVHLLPDFEQGACAVQDEAAQLAATLLDLKPGLRVLDACCAPGGKLCHILDLEPKLKACVGLDCDETRLQRVYNNLTRLKLTATLIHADAKHPELWWDGVLFDRILLDAPCSALGVIRRHPDIKWIRTPAEILQVVNTQAQLLQALWPLLAPGGRLVYATCSILPMENEDQIATFVAQNNDAYAITEPNPLWGRPTGHGWQILPGSDNMDGFFYGILKKRPPLTT